MYSPDVVAANAYEDNTISLPKVVNYSKSLDFVSDHAENKEKLLTEDSGVDADTSTDARRPNRSGSFGKSDNESHTPSKREIEPLLQPDENRFVMFPIRHNDVWDLYKKSVDSFWKAEDLDLSKDPTDWKKLTPDVQNFIKMVLAFFAASDGVIVENLALRFMSEVQAPEIRAFYAFQNFMENIHCVTGETKILTDTGYFMIKDLENKKVNIWNGEEFSEVEIKYTGDQEIYNVKLSNGMELDCTSGHKWLIRTGNQAHPERCVTERIETKDLIIGSSLARFNLPVISNCDDPNEFMNPYMHGFFCGDGSYCNKYPIIHLYGKKRELLPHFKYNSLQENDKRISFYIHNYINKPKFEVPINYSIDTKLRWLEGYADSDGCVNLNSNKDAVSIQISSINLYFLKDVQFFSCGKISLGF